MKRMRAVRGMRFCLPSQTNGRPERPHSERRRNIHVAEVVAFSRCFTRPIGWFLLPPPGTGGDRVEPTTDDRFDFCAADLAALAVGTAAGWAAFVSRITELLSTDQDAVWEAMQSAFSGVKQSSWESQIDLRRRAVQQATVARFASPQDEIITGMAALLVELVKSTPLGARRYGLPRLTLHGLRRTWATIALEQGIHPRVVQERFGHSTISITLGMYSHVGPTHHDEAASTVAALFL